MPCSVSQRLVWSPVLALLPVGLAIAAEPVAPAAAARVEIGTAENTATQAAERKAVQRRHQQNAARAADQGRLGSVDVPFHVPMLRPGMPGRYDLAGWHRAGRREGPLTGDQLQAPQPLPPPWYVPLHRPGMAPPYDLRSRPAPAAGGRSTANGAPATER